MNKTASIFTASALALAVAGAAQAYTIEAGDTTANIYGYAKLDAIYDVDAKLGNAVNRNAIRLDGQNGSDGHADLHAYQTRLGFTTSTPVGGSELKTMVEGDFYGSGGGELRLRHGYGEWNGILAGQTWTNFGGFLGMTPTVDFNGQPGQANVGRQAQLRYTTGGFSIALEDPENAGGSPTASYSYQTTSPIIIDGETQQLTSSASGDGSQSRLPDLTMRYQGGVGNFNYAASALLRQLRYDTSGQANAPAAWSSDTATGWGLNLEANAKVAEGVTLRGSITHGDGIGGYQYISPYGSPAYVDSNGNLETIKGTGGTAGISVAAGPGNVNLAYGIATVDLDDAVADGAVAATANETFDGLFLNYIWSPVRNVTYGIEAGWHSRETVGGEDGDAVRVQGMVQYNF
ncbi:DcaP family trimeric outer membrane transporter [Halomonas sp. RA08-2]|uniref:DcaP family trimeric outer membrane transporter n=1 Tax=Halomonas sp. RA08-2 TaxID=3440842 RepID=UPI003EEAC61E